MEGVDELVAGGGVVDAFVTSTQVGNGSLSLVRTAGDTVTITAVSGILPFPSQYCSALAASGASDLLLECGLSGADGTQGFCQLYGTTDGGPRWTRSPIPGKGAGTDNFGIADGGDGHAVIATGGLGGGLLSTTDFVQSWSLVLDIPGPNPAGFGDLGFEDSMHGVVIFDP